MTGHGLLRKLRLISKLMTSQPGKQTTAIDILPNISRRKRKSDIEICSVNPHMHEIFLQRYSMKWFPGDPLKEMIN